MGVLSLACVTEYFIMFRRRVERSMRRTGTDKDSREFMTALLYVCQVMLGYQLMLVAMTYQIELFIYLLAGLFLGFYHFNSSGYATGFEAPDPCCVGQNNYNNLDSGGRTVERRGSNSAVSSSNATNLTFFDSPEEGAARGSSAAKRGPSAPTESSGLLSS